MSESGGFEIPLWSHLRPSPTDSISSLEDKLNQLRNLSKGLRNLVGKEKSTDNGQDVDKHSAAEISVGNVVSPSCQELGQSAEPNDIKGHVKICESTGRLHNAESDIHKGEQQRGDEGTAVCSTPESGVLLKFPFPVISAKLSASGRYLCVFFGVENNARSHRCEKWPIQLIVLQMDEYSSQPKLLGGCKACIWGFESGPSTSQLEDSWNLLESQDGPLVITSGIISLGDSDTPDSKEAIKCITCKQKALQLERTFHTEAAMHCVTVIDNYIIAAGDQGRGCVWCTSQSWTQITSQATLPPAKYRHICFDTIVELKAVPNREAWILGTSIRGSIALWDFKKPQLITTVHHASFRVSLVHPLPVISSKPGMDREYSFHGFPIALLGKVSQRWDEQSKSKIAALLLMNGMVNIGGEFPIEGMERLCVSGEVGFVALDTGQIVQWNVIEGTCLWATDRFKEASISSMSLSPGCPAVLVGTRDGELLIRSFAECVDTTKVIV